MLLLTTRIIIIGLNKFYIVYDIAKLEKNKCDQTTV